MQGFTSTVRCGQVHTQVARQRQESFIKAGKRRAKPEAMARSEQALMKKHKANKRLRGKSAVRVQTGIKEQESKDSSVLTVNTFMLREEHGKLKAFRVQSGVCEQERGEECWDLEAAETVEKLSPRSS